MVPTRVIISAVAAAALSLPSAATSQTPAPLSGYTMAIWNIAKLATEGRLLFGDGLRRRASDYDNLRRVRDAVSADIYALQEISSPAALRIVFDPADFILCISGQWRADAAGLAPNYSQPRVTAENIHPLCFEPGDPTPDTAGDDSKLQQYVALAVRRTSRIKVTEQQDARSLSVMALDRGKGEGDAELRKVRWGLDVVLRRDDQALRLLVVHLKASCTDEAIPHPPAALPTFAGAGPEPACNVVSRQRPELKRWIDQAARTGAPFAIVGDFNRRFTMEVPDGAAAGLALANRYWPVLTGEAGLQGTDRVPMTFLPGAAGDTCYPWDRADYKHPIDYFVFSGAGPAGASVEKIRFSSVKDARGRPLAPDEASAATIVGMPRRPPDDTPPDFKPMLNDAFRQMTAVWADRLSDHCPRKLTVR